MIYMFTGQPGHGKTLRALWKARELQRSGRVVYVGRVKGLDYEKTGFQPLPDFKLWPSLPDGAVILLDECYLDMPKRASGAKVPSYIELLATHRHRGFDFLFVCQSPTKQVDPFVHDLIEDHTHVRRLFGFNVARLKTWDRYEPNPNKATPLRLTRWPYDKSLFGLYTSTEMDTTEKRLPWYVWGAPAGVVLLLLGGWAYGERLQSKIEDAESEAGDVRGTSAAAGSVFGGNPVTTRPEDENERLRREDYAAWLTPRIASQPWTAPAYDDLTVTTTPDVACMSSEVSCTCLSEQGTRYSVPDEQCRFIARHGQYNPFRVQSVAPVSGQAVEPVAPALPATVAGVVTSPTAVGSPAAGTVQGAAVSP